MSTAALPREARRNVVAFFAVGKEAKADSTGDPTQGYTKSWVQVDGKRVLQVRNMPVFRSGTFRDSMGIQHTWDDIHIDHMVQNFQLLKDRSLLMHLPVRKGHPGFLTNPSQVVDDIIGYHEALRTARMQNEADGKEYNYLFADYDILDPDAGDKIDRGQWRNMSAEVGHWFTNDEAEYWPVYSGVAYADFAAVEGLKNYSSANGVGSYFSIMTEQEQQVGDNGQQGQQGQGTQVPPPPAGVPTPNPQPPAQPPVPPAAQPPTQVQTFEFTMAGRKVSDFAAVQAHIQKLEGDNARYEQTFREQKEGTRKTFVKSLAEGDAPRILATQLDATEKFALSLTDEQFTVWKGQWEATAPNPVLGQQGGGQQFQNGQQTPGQQQNGTELDTAKEIISNFQMTGMTPDQIKNTDSYKKLAAANMAPAL
jgi:hypothetical protein